MSNALILSNGEKEISIEVVLKKLNKLRQAHYTNNFSNCPDELVPVLVAQIGRKNIKIVSEKSDGTERSVYCFLDFAGNIYKAASWRAPAKHIRGSVFDKNVSWGKGLGPYGAAYMK